MFPRGVSGPALALCVPLLLPLGMAGAAWFLPRPATSRAEASALESDFLKEFKKHLAAQNTAEMQKLVKGQTSAAVITVVEVAEEIAAAPSEELETLHAALRDAWKAVHKTEFAEKVYRFFSNINASTKKNLADLKKAAEPGLREWENNQEKKDAQTFDLVEAKLREYIDYFDQEGDLYHASELAAICARSTDEVLRPGGDLHLAYGYYARAVEYREKLDLKDGVFEECTKRKAALAARGFDKKKGGEPAPQEPGGAPPPKPEKPVSTTPLKVPLAFEVVGTFDAFQRPTYYADDIFEIWNGVPLEKARGEKATFPQMGSLSPTFQRFGATDVKMDVDGDGKMDEKVPLTGNIVPVKITVGKGDSARPWAFLVVTGQQQSIYQGIQVNLAPVDEQTTLLTLGAASVVGDVGGTKLRIIDETFDAIYGSRPLTYGFVGISDRLDPAKERLCYQPDFDTMVVGAAKRARPFSQIANLDGHWYRLEVLENGKELIATPEDVETGTIKLDFKGAVAPAVVIIRGKDGSPLERSWYDITEGGAKGIQVPVGVYELAYGEIRKGKKKQIQKCVILPGKTAPTWGVRRGETTVVELGAPFGIDFVTIKEEEKTVVHGRSVRVVGKAGERYERTWNCIVVPEAGFRKKGAKGKAAKYEKMTKPGDNEIMNKPGGWDNPWSPLDLVLDTKGHGEVEVQLVLKAHDFFGKIESAWKE